MDGNTTVEMITLDKFAQNKNIKIDFIKADIEGAERLLIQGAKNVLKEHQPILSICTYHNTNDVYVLKKLIMKINPSYHFIQRNAKFMAYVPSN